MAYTFDYINMGVVDCRVRGIYGLLLKCDYESAQVNIANFLSSLERACEVDCDRYKPLFDAFSIMHNNLLTGSYARVHDKLRDLHYKIKYAGANDDDGASIWFAF